jgi:cell division protein FtsL
MKIMNLVFFIVAIFMLGFIVKVKYEVNNLLGDIKSINRKLAQEQKEINSLRAEWTYLNNPSRLASLANKYLHLNKIYLDRVAEIKPGEGVKPIATEAKQLVNLTLDDDNDRAKTKWNFKKEHHYEFRNGNLVHGRAYQVKYN